MGSACAKGNSVEQNGHQPSYLKNKSTISVLVSPFRLTRDDAEKLLKSSQIGAYVLSHDFTEERFISVSSGKFVCHHAISVRDDCCIVGGEIFCSIQEALHHYEDNPLGGVYLTQQFSDSPSLNKRSSLKNNGSRQRKKSRKVSFKNLSNPNIKIISDSPLAKIVERNSSVSSAGEKEQQLLSDEPIPVLPPPSGNRPPPLYSRFSQLAMDHQSIDADSTKTLLQLYKGNPGLHYTPRVNEIKVLMFGLTDQLQERENIFNSISKSMDKFTEDEGYLIDLVDVSVKSSTVLNQEELIQEISSDIKDLKMLNIPYLSVIFLTDQCNKLLLPSFIPDHEFKEAFDSISEKDRKVLMTYFTLDNNRTDVGYVLNFDNNDVSKADVVEIMKRSNDVSKAEVVEIMKRSKLSNCLQTALETQINLTCGKDSQTKIILVERKLSDTGVELQNNNDEVLENNNDGEFGNSKDGKFGNSNVGNNAMAQYLTDITCSVDCTNEILEGEGYVKIELSIDLITDIQKHEEYFKMISCEVTKLMHLNLRCLIDKLHQKTMKDIEYDEVVYHIMKSQIVHNQTAPDDSLLEKVKEYIKGDSNLPLMVNAPKSIGRLSLMSHALFYAFDWFAGECCIVSRYCGETPDSTSFSLLLKSICMQISCCYSMEQKNILQNTTEGIQYFKDLLELPTDSLPLLLILDSSDCIKHDDVSILSLLPEHLPRYVKVIISMESLQKEGIENSFEFLRMDDERNDGLEQLDHVLVRHERTLSRQQQGVVTELLVVPRGETLIRYLAEELILWKSTDDKEFKLDSASDCYTELYKKTSALFSSLCIDGAIFCISQGEFGVPKRIINTFLKKLLKTKEKWWITNTVDTIIRMWSSICFSDLISGLCFIRWYDNKEAQTYFKDSRDSKDDFEKCLKEAFIEETKNNHNGTSLLQYLCLCHLLHCGSSKSIELHDGSDINALVVFRYFYTRLKYFSIFHVMDDIEQIIKKYPSSNLFQILKDFFNLSHRSLSNNKERFPLQILCRISEALSSHSNGGNNNNDNNKQIEQIDENTLAYIRNFTDSARKECSSFQPSTQCLLTPVALCKLSYDEQSNWKTRDLRIVFASENIDFITYSCQQGFVNIHHHDNNVQTIKINSLLSVKYFSGSEQVSIISKTSNFLSDVNDICNLIPLELNDREMIGMTSDMLICLNQQKTSLLLLHFINHQVVWKYDCHVTINDVILSKNNSVAVCFLEANEVHNNTSENNWNIEDVVHVVYLNEKKSMKICSDKCFTKLSCVSACGKYFLRATELDMTIVVWDLTTLETLFEIHTHSCRLLDIAVNEQSKTIISLAANGTVAVYDLANGKLLHTLVKTTTISSSTIDGYIVTMSDDGSRAAVSENIEYTPSSASLWDLRAGELLVEFISDFTDTLFQIAPNGKYVLSNFPKGLIKFNI